jgi:hypothetical protein
MCVAYPEPLVERLYMEVKNLLTSHMNKIYAVSVLLKSHKSIQSNNQV